MKDKLEPWDIIVVSNALVWLREYKVKKVYWNKAFTDFRTFNTKIYPWGNIYEYWKKYDPYGNWYWIK